MESYLGGAASAQAIHYAHQRGVLHRDLKPGHILLDGAGEPVVADFGLARALDQDSALTRTGAFFGSPAYTAPEQAATMGRGVTIAADIYGRGTILYELLTGRPPFAGKDTLETLRAVVETDPIAPRQLWPTVPRDLEIIALKCLEKELARRYTTAQAALPAWRHCRSP
jgi:eukaryotic-like serine/threonine-protein kinase